MSEEEPIAKYAITIAKLHDDGTVQFQTSAGAEDLDLFTKTDLMKFIAHFKKQLAKVEASPIGKADK